MGPACVPGWSSRWSARPQCWPRRRRAPSTSRGARTAAASRARASGFDFGGSASLGVSVYNPTYAARPDNTGLALFRYAVHFDFDLIGRRLSIPLDINMFTDRLAIGFARKLGAVGAGRDHRRHQHLAPGTGRARRGRALRDRRDMDRGGYPPPPASSDRSTPTSRSATCTRWRAIAPGVAPALGGRRRARLADAGLVRLQPDLLRAPRQHRPGAVPLRRARRGLDLERPSRASGWTRSSSPTSRRRTSFRPSELDFTPELIARFSRYEVHLAYERDMPIDQDGLIQQFVYLLGSVSF